jgi:asparagine synthase (glutamine-hydrolysing)
LKIREHKGHKIEKWILRKAFQHTDLLPEEILWRCKVQYSQGAGCQDLGERLAEKEMTDSEVERIKAQNPKAEINSKEAAYYFKIFRKYFPKDAYLECVGIWKGFDFAEERERVRGTVDGDRTVPREEPRKEETREETPLPLLLYLNLPKDRIDPLSQSHTIPSD